MSATRTLGALARRGRTLLDEVQLSQRLREPLTLVRVGLCLVFLVRHERFLPSAIDFEGHIWGPGSEYGSQTLARVLPQFVYPLIPGFDLVLPWSDALCRVRLLCCLLLLVGVLPRLNAAALALISFGLFAADGFRYLHHVLVLYVSLAHLAFPHVPRARRGVPFALLMLRCQVVVVYLAAGLAKCQSVWLSGATVSALVREGVARGPVMQGAVGLLGFQGLAVGAWAAELLAPLLLLWPRTRPWGALVALGLHAFIQATIEVSTFGATMVVLLGSFLPTRAEREDTTRSLRTPPLRQLAGALALTAALPIAAQLAGTSVGAFSMFTRLVTYHLSITIDQRPVPRSELAAHLGRDGARIVRLANGRGVGEANVEILRRSLPKLARFLCVVRPQAEQVDLRLVTRRIEGGDPARFQAAQPCLREG